jgi:adenine-specific DNA-methyltransferase
LQGFIYFTANHHSAPRFCVASIYLRLNAFCLILSASSLKGSDMTELIWDGKYDKDGKRVAPLRVSLPFQTVETINESTIERQRTLDLFSAGRDSEWRNRLIWGDKKYILPSLLDEFAGKVNLIYIDPPFNVGADFSYTATIPDNPETNEDETTEFYKEPSVIEQKAYRDTWGKGLDSYVQWFYETVVFLRELLAENGTVIVHLDYRIGHYAKTILDEVFGIENNINEIIWHYKTFQGQTHRYFARKHDNLFWYSKTVGQFKYTEQFDTEFEDTIDSKRWSTFINDNQQIVGANMPTQDSRFMRYLNKWVKEHGRQPKPEEVVFEVRGQPVDSVWDMKGLDPKSIEKTGYPTQKPEELLERIINATSDEGDLILDCFCGSGTTAAVAEKLNRRWITCDLGRFSIHTTRKRLLGIEGIKPFVVQNLGKYERQAWIETQFEDKKNSQKKYREFILNLYHARPLNQHTWLHGVKSGRMVHIGSVDAPVTTGDLANIAAEFKKAIGTGKDAPKSNGVDVLGWDFAFEMNEVAKQQAAQANLDVRFIPIPRDVMDKRAVEQGDIKFFELAALDVSVKVKKLEATLTLKDFVIPPDDVPQEVQKAIKHWSQWVDYWAVDWDFKEDTFHNQWQTYRTRKEPELKLSTDSHHYDEAGEYIVVVKVIDILGNDTTKTIKIKVG